MFEYKEKADLGMFKVMLDLKSKGYDVFTPTVSQHLRFDLIIHKDSKMFRVQAKYRSVGDSSLFIPNSTSWADKSGSHKCYYENDDFDYFAIYVPEFEKIIYPSIKFAGASVAFKIPNCATPFYWFEDFLELTDTAEKKTYKDFGFKLKKINSRMILEKV
jgi:hypothetical protein